MIQISNVLRSVTAFLPYGTLDKIFTIQNTVSIRKGWSGDHWWAIGEDGRQNEWNDCRQKEQEREEFGILNVHSGGCKWDEKAQQD